MGLRGEELRAVFGEEHVVFQADAEFAAQVDAGFVGKSHSGLEQGGVVADEVGPFVAIHADAVAEAVGEVGIVGAEASVVNDFAGGGIDRSAGKAGFGCGKCGGLGAMDDVKDVLLPVGWLAKGKAAADVGLIALDGAAVIDENQAAVFDGLGLDAAVGQRGEGIDLATGIAGEAGQGIGLADPFADVGVGDAGAGGEDGLPGGLIDLQSDVVGELHQSKFRGGLDCATAGGNGRGADDLECRAGLADTVGEDEGDAFLNSQLAAQLSGGDAEVFEALSDERIRILILLPGVDPGVFAAGSLLHLLPGALFFKAGADVEGCALAGQDGDEEALGVPPADAGVVDERCAADEGDGIDSLLSHECLCTDEALLALGKGDRPGLGAAVFERGQRCGKTLSRFQGLSHERCRDCDCRNGCYGSGRREKAAAGEHMFSTLTGVDFRILLGTMKKRFCAIWIGLLCLSVLPLQGRVVKVEELSRTQLGADGPDEGRPAYEKVLAKVLFAVSPADAHNKGIVDLEKAPRNAQGEVEFSADLFLLRPLARGNGAMLLEIPNRGGKGILGLVDGGKADPASSLELGDGWLLNRGFTFASLGWQWDVTPAPGSLKLYAPVAMEAGGKHISGLLRDDFTPSERAVDEPLGHIMGARLGGTEYAAAAPDDPRNALTVRDSPHGARKLVPRADWSFAHLVDGKLAASDRFIHLNSGFQPGKTYELVYVVQDPVVAGLGFAAVRDFVSWMKYSPDSLSPVKLAYAAGISQCGRFLRDLLYQDFNADEADRMVLDGVLGHVGGAGRGSFNYRFAQPSRDAQPTSSIDWPTDIFPFTDLPEVDPQNPKNGAQGLLDAVTAHKTVPKIFFSHTSYEYWGRAAALIHTTADGKADAPISPNVRIYFYTGLQHYSVPFPPEKASGDRLGQQLPSPLPIRWFWRAMIANMDAWVRNGAEPPPSKYPKIADGTLVPLEKLRFPAVPGLKPPATAARGTDLDFGPNWRGGILSQQPRAEVAEYPALVPQVDINGNDEGGVSLPEITVPLATYTGWNLRDKSIGAPEERTAFLGSFVPFRRSTAEAKAAHDPRAGIEDRYQDFAGYQAKYQAALDALVRQRYILPEDAGHLSAGIHQEWSWTAQFWENQKH